jgi:hypothetical protein
MPGRNVSAVCRLGADEHKARFEAKESKGKMTEPILTGTIEEIVEKAERILKAIAPDAWCLEQEWDSRIDCGIRQADGIVVAEMILLRNATETRIRECAERLLLRQKGVPVSLQDELLSPIRISRSPT